MGSSYQRRDFLKTIGGLSTGLVFGSGFLSSCNSGASKNINKEFGLQLYTLRDVIGADPKGILKQVSSFGYKEIESYEGDQGIFWGMKNTEFKKLMDDLGMQLVSSHKDINKDFDRIAGEA